MFGIGFGELVVIGALLLIAVGPRRMPMMMKSIGRAMREFKRATRELRAQTGIDELLAEDDVIRPPSSRSQLRPANNRSAAALARQAAADLAAREYPPEGVDAAEANAAPPPKVEA
jgi:sec-independent protein translocase protein TatB